jgi:hypothetical protein
VSRSGGGQNTGGTAGPDRDRQGPGNVAGGSAADTGDRMGGTGDRMSGRGDRVGQDVGNRAVSDANRGSIGLGGPSASRFGGNLNTNREGVSRPGLGDAMAGTGMSERDIANAAAARAAENYSMDSLDRARQTALGELHRSAEDAVTTGADFSGILGKMRKAEGADYNTLSGGKTADLENMTVRDAVQFSSMPWSGKLASVLGGYQFKGPTLAGIAKEMGLLDAKMSKAVQDKLAQGLAQQRANQATVNGKIDVDKFAKALGQEWASFATPAGLSHYAANGVDKASLSWADTKALAKDMIDKGFVTPGGSVANLPTGSVTTQRPQSFVDKYLTAPQTQPMDRAADPHMATVATDRGTAPPSTKDASVYGNQPEGPQAGTEYPDRPRNTGEKFAAGVIDTGIGLISPIGGMVNTGLGLLGSRTAGERAVDYLASLGGQPGDYKFNGETGSAGDAGVKHFADKYLRPPTDTKPTDEKPPVDDTDVAFVDKTKRPTPYEKYDKGRLTFGLGG